MKDGKSLYVNMSGENSSTMTGSVTAYLFTLVAGGKAALAELPAWERYLFIFWLVGPFIL